MYVDEHLTWKYHITLSVNKSLNQLVFYPGCISTYPARPNSCCTIHYNITKAKRVLSLANSASTICPRVYAADVLTKVKCALCDVAQFVVDLLGYTS